MVEETEPPVEEIVSLTQRQYDAIMQRITELEARAPQQPSKAVKLPTGKPAKFNGERDDQKARLWLSEVDTQVRMHMRMDSGMKEEDKTHHRRILPWRYRKGTAQLQSQYRWPIHNVHRV